MASEGVRARCGDDNVVNKVDVKEWCRLLDTLCESYIGLARLAASGWVVVSDNNLCSKQFERTFEYQTVIHNRGRHHRGDRRRGGEGDNNNNNNNNSNSNN